MVHALPEDVMSTKALCGQQMTMDARKYWRTVDSHYVNCPECLKLFHEPTPDCVVENGQNAS